MRLATPDERIVIADTINEMPISVEEKLAIFFTGMCMRHLLEPDSKKAMQDIFDAVEDYLNNPDIAKVSIPALALFYISALMRLYPDEEIIDMTLLKDLQDANKKGEE